MNILEKFSLSGKSALITNPEYPYGVEIAQGLQAAGASVWLAGADPDILHQISNRLLEKGCQISGYFPYKQGTETAALALSDAIKKELPSLNILVDNSSGHTLHGWDHTFDEIFDQMQFTQLGLMLTVKHLGALMADQGHGSVIFVSDYAALAGCDPQNYNNCPQDRDTDFSIDYGFVKGSYVNYARQAAGYLGAHNCRCNCIAYGPLTGTRNAGFEEAFIRHSHLKRLAGKEDVAAAAVFLASDASAYITGITLPVDGGYTAK